MIPKRYVVLSLSKSVIPALPNNESLFVSVLFTWVYLVFYV